MTKEESKGNMLVVISIFIWSLFPVFSKFSVNSINPLVAYWFTTMFASIPFFVLIVKRNRFKELIKKDVLIDSFLSAFWIGLLFYGFYFYALNVTRAGNASIAALSEIFWSFLFFNVFKKELLEKRHILGGVFMLIGTLIILVPKSSGWFIGDTILLFATMFAPIGNFFQRRARGVASSETILFLRVFFTTVLLFFAINLMNIPIIENIPTGKTLWIILLNGALTLGLSKIFWLEGIFRVNVTKALAISALTPFLTLFFSFLILKEIPTLWQMTSLLPMVLGMILLTTKYNFYLFKKKDKM